MYPFIYYNYEKLYAPKLGLRANSFRSVFLRLLQQTPHHPTIVETGCINDPGNWAGHGQSTIMFDAITKTIGGHVFSVDISPDAITATRGLVSNNVILNLGNSLNFLQAFNQPIDLLYLDGFDLNLSDPSPSATHTLYEFIAAIKNLHTGSIVCVDDTWWHDEEDPFGKGQFICGYMKAINAERLTKPDGCQVAWMLK